jgi:hypothetical protein
MICPNCDEDSVDEIFSMGSNYTNEVYWCYNCGAVAIGYNEGLPDPDEWSVPTETNGEL